MSIHSSRASIFLCSLLFAAVVSVIWLMGGSAVMLEPSLVRATVLTALGLIFVFQTSRERSIATQVQFALVRQRFVPRENRIQVNDPLLL